MVLLNGSFGLFHGGLCFSVQTLLFAPSPVAGAAVLLGGLFCLAGVLFTVDSR